MATTREVLEFIIKADGTAASSSFKKIGSEVDSAGNQLTKASGKFQGALDKIGLSGVASSTLIGGGIAAAGVAVAGFAVKAVGDFQEVALAAGKLAESTGLSTEQASRWNEVAQDVGVSSETLEVGFRKLAQNIGNNPEKFRALGLEIAKTKDGTTDMNGTILNAIDLLNRTPDAADRAALGMQLFGKNWSSLSEFIGRGSEEIKQHLQDVSDVKIIDDKELASARQMRDTLDNLSDVVEDLTLTFGQFIIGAIGPTINAVAELAGHVDSLLGPLGGLGNTAGTVAKSFAPGVAQVQGFSGALDSNNSALHRVKDGLSAIIPPLNLLPSSWFGAESAAEKAQKAADKFAGSQRDVAKAATDSRAAGDSSIRAYDALGEAYSEAATAGDIAAGVAERLAKQQQAAADSAENARRAEDSLRDSRNKSLDTGIKAIDAEKKRVQAGAEVLQYSKDVAEAEAAVAEARKKHGRASKEAREADEKLATVTATITDRVYDYGKAALDAADAQAEASHQTLNATQRQAIFGSSLLDAAGKSKVAQSAVANYISQLNEIDPIKKTEIVAAINRGDLVYAQSVLNSLRGSATIGVYADLRNFWADVNYAKAHVGTATVRVTGAGSSYGGRPSFAAGTPSFSGGWAMVGERGPELVNLPQGSSVIPNHQIGTGGNTINVYMPPGADGADVVVALERYAQRSGKARLRSLVS